MLQDSKGYMWLSSQDGINRYNGKDFFHFGSAYFFENCEPVKNIFGIVEDAKADIWMGSIQGLYRYQRDRNTFKKYDLFENKNGSDKICVPFASVGREIWVSDGDLGFKAIDCYTQQIRTLYEPPDSLESNHYSFIVPQPDGEGNIWIAKENMLYEIILKDKTIHQYPLFLSAVNESKNITVNGLSLNSANHLLAIATNRGLFLFDTEKKQDVGFNDANGLVTNTEIWYVKADDDCFWVSNPQCHLTKLGLTNKTAVPIIENKVLDNEIHRGTTTACIYKDKWNRLWINAEGEYIGIIDFEAPFIKKVARDNINGLPSGTVNSITIAGNDVWVSDTYLNVINKQSGQVKKIFPPKELPGSPSGFQQIFYDSSLQRIWINVGYNIYYYDLKAAAFVKSGLEILLKSNNDNLRCYLKLKTGELLAVYKSGVYHIDKQGLRIQLVSELGGGSINHLAELSGNRLALSVIGSPLKIYQYGPGLQLKLLRSIELDYFPIMVSEDPHNGIIWAATERGVYKIDSTYKVLHHYTTADGMANDYVYAVIPDKYGSIWCSTNKGIVSINSTNDRVLNFDITHNLQDLEFNNRAFASDNDGYIYFGGVKGLNYFKPPITVNDTIQPKLVIEEISVDNKPYLYNVNPDAVENIRYKYGAAALSIKVQALHLLKATSLKIIYRLKGVQKDWVEINNGDNIQMFNLASGNYELEISYRYGSIDNETGIRTIKIKVLPYWYNTWWFMLLASLAAIAGIWFIVVSRQKRKLKKLQQENEIFRLKAEQELIVINERERIISDLHDDVGATLSSIHIYGDMAENVWETRPEASKEILGKITEQAKELMAKMGDIIWSMKPVNDQKNSITAKLKNYASELLAPKDINCDFDIDETMCNKITNPVARKNILLIVKEAMNNIAKYSGASHVSISFLQAQETVVLTVRDNGKGFSKSEILEGNGLGNMQQRCEQLSGSFDIKSITGKGVAITCSFPIAIFSYS